MTASLAALLDEHRCGTDEPLVHTTDATRTKAEVLDDVAALAARISPHRPGTPVLVVADGYDALVAMFAVWRVAGVFVPVSPRSPRTAIERVAASSDVAAIIEGGVVTPRSSTTTHPAGTAFVLWTSGTTGAPKAILHRHDAYLEIIDRVLGPLSVDRDHTRPPSPNLIPVSLSLNAGIYNALFGLRAGAPLVLMDRFETTAFAELVARHAVRSTVLPPAAITMLNDDETVRSLEPLRYVRSITAPLSPFQAHRFQDRFGVFVLNGYGQAELGEVIGWTASDAKAHPERIGAVGRPHGGVDVRLAEPVDGIGELLVRPPVHPSEGVARTLGDRLDDDGYVRTGDFARIDEAGFVWIEGRVSDLINRGGNKVFPDEVEEVLATVAGVEDVAVAGVPDDRLGQVPVAFVVGPATDAALDEACRSVLVPYKVPVRYERVATIPRNEAGKILRRELTS